MIVLGLTGSVAMGKSTVTSMFAELGAATSNSDEIVHRLLESDQEVLVQIKRHFPAVMENGVVDRKKLGDRVFNNPRELKLLEDILHPRVQKVTKAFIQLTKEQGKWLVVLDIPLLYETGAEKNCNYVVVVTASAEIQRERVMARPGMTEEKFRHILAQQMPDAEKRQRANFIVSTDQNIETTFRHVQAIVDGLKKREELLLKE